MDDLLRGHVERMAEISETARDTAKELMETQAFYAERPWLYGMEKVYEYFKERNKSLSELIGGEAQVHTEPDQT